MTQVNVKGSGKRSEVETLECTGSCNGRDLISSSSHSLTRVSPSCQIHIPKPEISSCFSTMESTCLQKDGSRSPGAQPKQDRKVKWDTAGSFLFPLSQKASDLKPALMALRRHGGRHGEPAQTLSLPHALRCIYRITFCTPFWEFTKSFNLNFYVFKRKKKSILRCMSSFSTPIQLLAKWLLSQRNN